MLAIRRHLPGRLGPKAVAGLAVLVASVGITIGPALALFDHGLPIKVHIQQQVAYLSPDSAFGDAISGFRLSARSGSLLDVQGQPLRVGIYPGQILLNGRTQSTTTRLREGDRITVVDEGDRREQLVQEVVPVRGGAPGNPQFYLGNVPGEEVITKGALSSKVVSTIFRPTGTLRLPLAVALTFDDGPWPGSTEQVLATLKRFRVKATFFLIGRQAQVHPGLVQAELAADMIVGNHTWDHPLRPPFATLSHQRMNDEIATTNDVLDSLGAGGCLFRPPGGSYSKEVLDVASAVRCRVVLWSVDPKDWMPGRTSAEIARSVLSSVRPGSIILLHDGGGNRSATIAALPSIIKGILKKGLKIVPVTTAP